LGILSVASLTAGIEGEDAGMNRREAISRVKFSVMMTQPANISIAKGVSSEVVAEARRPNSWMGR
jgi:hypothetical protein